MDSRRAGDGDYRNAVHQFQLHQCQAPLRGPKSLRMRKLSSRYSESCPLQVCELHDGMLVTQWRGADVTLLLA